MTRPHLDPRLVALVAAGGMVGTGGRYLVSTAVHSPDRWPTATLVENVVGSFLLGVLLETLLRRGPESHRGRLVRLGLGTGVLGGFTTFSSYAIELERLLADGALLAATSYALASLVGGLAACLLGVVVATRHASLRSRRAGGGPGADLRDDVPGQVRR